MLVHEDRLFPADPSGRAIARSLYASVKDLPIVSPHGHTDPRWFADNEPFPRPGDTVRRARPLRLPDALQPGRAARGPRRAARRRRAGRTRPARDLAAVRRALSPVSRHADAASGSITPSRRCSASTSGCRAATADAYYDRIADALATPGVPAARAVRALQHRGDRHHRVRRSTRSTHHETIRESGWKGRVITAYRPDPVVDPGVRGLRGQLARASAS